MVVTKRQSNIKIRLVKVCSFNQVHYLKYYFSYVKTHFNHEIELSHHRRSKLETMKIVRLLMGGLTAQKVYFKLIEAKEIKMLTMKEIINTQSKFGINQNERLSNDDLESIELHVEKDKQSDYPKYSYKPIGQTNPSFPGLASHDFFLVLMSEFQVQQLTKYLKGRFKIVCIDATHLTNQYGYKLIVLMVLDEFHEGIAVGFCITNRETEVAIKCFLKIVKEKSGNLTADYFMSDDNPAYYAAWVCIFNDNSCIKLLCSWHIDRAWKENLKKIPIDLRKEIYKQLKALQIELSKENFDKLKDHLYKQLMANPVTKYFGLYLDKNYFNRCQTWAYCFRINSNINLNMHLESFNKRFKYGFMNGRPARRLDFLLKSLNDYLMIQEYELEVKQVKGKTSKLLRRSTFQNHKKAQKNEENFSIEKLAINIDENDEDVLEVYKINNVKNGKSYQLINRSVDKDHLCRFYCKECKICICKLSCTCIRYSIRTKSVSISTFCV